MKLQLKDPAMERKKANIDQAKDTGLAMILILLLFVYLGKYYDLVLLAIVVLLFTMTWPAIFGPLARVWFGLSRFLGSIVSKILLTFAFCRANPNCIPKNPKLIFQICQKLNFGLVFIQ